MSLRDAPREFKDVPVGLIDAPALPSRELMDEVKLDELTRSIAAHGVISPLSVGRRGDRFEVVAGHRRLMASKAAGLVVVPCVVYASVGAAHEAIKFAENYYREDVNPADEAIWFSELLERDCGGDVDQLCAQLAIKRSYAEGRLLLFQGDREVFAALQAGKIGIGIAHELNRCTDEPHRRYLLDVVIKGGATKAVVTGYIQQWETQQRYASGAPAPASGAATLAAVQTSNYFTCYACRGTDAVESMRPINVHTHCQLAILDKALEQYQRRGDALLWPRTVDEARALASRLIEHFPDLVPVHP